MTHKDKKQSQLPPMIDICPLQVGEWVVAFFFAASAYVGLEDVGV